MPTLLSISVDGLTVGYQQAGSGPPLLLLHGAMSDSRDWRWQLESLSATNTVIAWEAPGCGHSSGAPDGWTMESYADCLKGFIDALGLDHPHVLGLSWGGGLALQLYERYPELPRSLILAGAYAGWAGSLPAEEVERRVQLALRQAEQSPEEIVPQWIPTLFSKSAPQEVVDEIMAISLEIRPKSMMPMLYAFARCDLRHMLPSIKVPVLLIYGELDTRSPLTVARELNEAIPGSKLVVIAGSGHLVNAEAPKQFNAAVVDFLRSIGGPPVS